MLDHVVIACGQVARPQGKRNATWYNYLQAQACASIPHCKLHDANCTQIEDHMHKTSWLVYSIIII